MYEYNAVVQSVHDGDSLRVDTDLGMSVWISDIPLRLLGIDAPELGKPGGKEARDYLRALLPVGTNVVIRTVKDEDDKYGRLLATITATGVDGDSYNVNQRMISDGHAVAYFGGKR